MTKSCAISVKNISFAYERQPPILENVSIDISRGEYIGIFGPNGGGKTTFFKLLLHFLKPTQGTISIFDLPSKEGRKKIGYVPQLHHYDKKFPLSVFELVLMGALSEANWWGTFPPTAKRKAEEAIAQVGLTSKTDDPFGTLSGGEAQRALIARALMSRPSILLLDEPTANVDVKAEEAIFGLLEKLKGTITILMVTHDLQTMLQRFDRVLCIHRKLTPLLPEQVCEHFALGLYHTPLSTIAVSHELPL